MRKHLVDKVKNSFHFSADIRSCPAEQLNVADGSVDYLVSTLVFCSVSDLQQSVKEAFRVLRPGGTLLLMEHIMAVKGSRVHFWQHLLQPFWKRIACNCHLTRQTGDVLKETGFRLDVREEVMRGAPSFASPMLVGHAIRP
jgi:ubiquinone/menaquinone biosynthesis C-methylase UbiE